MIKKYDVHCMLDWKRQAISHVASYTALQAINTVVNSSTTIPTYAYIRSSWLIPCWLVVKAVSSWLKQYIRFPQGRRATISGTDMSPNFQGVVQKSGNDTG